MGIERRIDHARVRYSATTLAQWGSIGYTGEIKGIYLPTVRGLVFIGVFRHQHAGLLGQVRECFNPTAHGTPPLIPPLSVVYRLVRLQARCSPTHPHSSHSYCLLRSALSPLLVFLGRNLGRSSTLKKGGTLKISPCTANQKHQQ